MVTRRELESLSKPELVDLCLSMQGRSNGSRR